MKHNLWTVLALCVSGAILAGCETLNIAPSEQACEYVYADIVQDSTETLRINLQNNKTLDAVNALE